MTARDKVTVVTGGSRGIGRAVAKAFAREGARVVLVARTLRDLEAARAEIQEAASAQVEVFPADVADPQRVRALVDFTLAHFGTVDILVNCAGEQAPIGPAAEVDAERWIRTVHSNLYGTFLCMQAILPIMIKNRRGKIVNFSGGGAVSPRPRFSAYSASKAAVVRLTETVAAEVKEYGIDINAVAPGAVNTRLLEEALEAGEAAGKEELAKALKQKQDGGVPPEKVAELVLFLASPATDGLTGRLISLLWDNWREIPRHLPEIAASDVYTMRRIIPQDRGHNW